MKQFVQNTNIERVFFPQKQFVFFKSCYRSRQFSPDTTERGQSKAHFLCYMFSIYIILSLFFGINHSFNVNNVLLLYTCISIQQLISIESIITLVEVVHSAHSFHHMVSLFKQKTTKPLDYFSSLESLYFIVLQVITSINKSGGGGVVDHWHFCFLALHNSPIVSLSYVTVLQW